MVCSPVLTGPHRPMFARARVHACVCTVHVHKAAIYLDQCVNLRVFFGGARVHVHR